MKSVESLRSLWLASVMESRRRERQAETAGRKKYSDEERRQAFVLYLEGC